MKQVFNKIFGVLDNQPETALESVEQLEEFLKADFGQKDWSVKFLHDHFKICKKDIKKIEKKRKKELEKIIDVKNKKTRCLHCEFCVSREAIQELLKNE